MNINQLIQDNLRLLRNSSQSFSKASLLIGRPWGAFTPEGKVQKLIFRQDKSLVISYMGKVVIGKWDYFSEAQSFLIDKGDEKLLLNEVFFDDVVLILKLDGSFDDYLCLVNETALPDYDIVGYINAKLKLFRPVSENTVTEKKKQEVHILVDSLEENLPIYNLKGLIIPIIMLIVLILVVMANKVTL